jgi:hypothetical protein
MMQANEKTETDLLGLAERCEAATCRDDLLALAIARATNSVINAAPIGADGKGIEHFRDFTGSIDAALTLVPEGAWWNVEGSAGSGYSACTMTPNESIAHTPALAICAAALRAKATGPKAIVYPDCGGMK